MKALSGQEAITTLITQSNLFACQAIQLNGAGGLGVGNFRDPTEEIFSRFYEQPWWGQNATFTVTRGGHDIQRWVVHKEYWGDPFGHYTKTVKTFYRNLVLVFSGNPGKGFCL